MIKEVLALVKNLDLKNNYSCGVYTITHLQYPDRFYVGSTDSNKKYEGFISRWKRHYRDLKNNKHCNNKLQNIVNKYGLSGIRFEIIDVYEPGYSVGAEQYWINMLNSYYNICKSAYSTKGIKPTIKQIEKRSRKVYCYSLEGEYIDSFINATFASEATNTDKGTISTCCYGKNNRGGNYIWSYEYFDKLPKYEKSTSTKILSYKDGKFFKEYDSILQASLELNIPGGNISRHLANNTSECYGFNFMYYKDNYDLFILPTKRFHKYQIRVKVDNLETYETTIYDSFNNSKEVISKSTLRKNYKIGNLEFIHKNKFKIKILSNSSV